MQMKLESPHVASVDLPDGVLASLQCEDGPALARTKRLLIYADHLKRTLGGITEHLEDYLESGCIDEVYVAELVAEANDLYRRIWG